MGTYKTQLIIHLLKVYENKVRNAYPYISAIDFIFLSCRQKFTINISEAIRKHGFDVLLYLDEDVNSDKFREHLGGFVIQMESLHRIIKIPHVLIIDEITSCMAQLNSPTMDNFYDENIKILQEIVKKSPLVLAMDADIDERSVILLKSLRSGEEYDKIKLYWNLYRRNNINAYEYAYKFEIFNIYE